MPAASLIDGKLDSAQASRAFNALLAHDRKTQKQREKGDLLAGSDDAAEHVWLVVGTKTMGSEKKIKPQRIPLAHPLLDPRLSPVCLITKDPQRQYKDLLASKNIKFVSRVVGVTKLKGKFKPFEARRQLAKEHDLFLADDRVIPLMPKLLGKIFFEAKKQPIPVDLSRKDLKAELERAISSTYMHQNRGTCMSIKIGTTAQSASHLIENLTTALPHIISRLPGKWRNVQSLHIKTSNSTSLPIWNCKLGGKGLGEEGDETGRWAGFEKAEEKKDGEGNDDDEEDEEDEKDDE